MTASRTHKNSKLILILMLLIIAGPMLFAWHLYFKGNTHQIKLSNNGDLISPPQNIVQATFLDLQKKQPFKGEQLLGKWWLVYVGPNKCYQECQTILYNMRQIRLALGKNTSRLERLFVPHPQYSISVCEDFLNEFYPDMLRVKIDTSTYQQLFRSTSSADNEMLGELFIIDPKGFVMMRYPAEMESQAILNDIKRLLKVSKVG